VFTLTIKQVKWKRRLETYKIMHGLLQYMHPTNGLQL
jgi:hypothetical protein